MRTFDDQIPATADSFTGLVTVFQFGGKDGDVSLTLVNNKHQTSNWRIAQGTADRNAVACAVMITTAMLNGYRIRLYRGPTDTGLVNGCYLIDAVCMYFPGSPTPDLQFPLAN